MTRRRVWHGNCIEKMKTFAALLLTFPLSALADTANTSAPSEPVKTPEVSPWSGEVEFGLIRATGNTNSNSANGKGKVEYNHNRWKHTATLAILNSSSNGTTTAQSNVFNGKSRYNFQEREYLFANLLYQEDHLSGYRSQVSETAGYGRRVIDQPELFLDLEAGAGARQSNPRTGPSTNEMIARGYGHLQWQVGPSSVFSQRVIIESGSNNTQTQSITSLKSKVNGSLAMKLSYTVKHNTIVPAGSAKTETLTSATLVMDF